MKPSRPKARASLEHSKVKRKSHPARILTIDGLALAFRKTRIRDDVSQCCT
jgi:hypothetical protein